MSAPGLKNFPLAVRMMTRTASSASSFPKAWSSSFKTDVVRRFDGGLFRVTVAILSATVTVTNMVAIRELGDWSRLSTIAESRSSCHYRCGTIFFEPVQFGRETSVIADRLAAYAQSIRSEDLPGDVVHEVKRRVRASRGGAFGAWTAEPCVIARRTAQAVTIPNGATLWGTAHKTLPDLAAFANGALVRYLDFNDTYLSKEPAHPSDNLSAVFAAGENTEASGRQVIEAIALAYEIQCRLCDAAALRPRGWDHVTYGPFSSALAAAKVLKLSQTQTVQAVNLAGVANVALRQTRVGALSMWKACAFSNAARNGVFAAVLAQQGMSGPSPIFEGEKGFMKLVSGPFDLPAFAGEGRARRDENSFKILETYIKHYPVEYHAQTAVEAALLVREQVLNAEGPRSLAGMTGVEIGSYGVAIEIIGRDEAKWRPRTRETADHSFPYCVAVALLDGMGTGRP